MLGLRSGTDPVLVVAGIPLPSASPLFLTILGVHVVAGLTAVVAGLIAMLSPKRSGRHPGLGTLYYWSLAVVFGSMTALSAMRWAEDAHLFFLGVCSFAAATLGRTARRRRWPGWARVHIPAMGLSYVFLATAFYVDNGPNLPLWRELPSIAYWVLPSAVDIPIILRALRHHPLARGLPK